MLRPMVNSPRRPWLVIIAGTLLAIGAGLLVAKAVEGERPAAEAPAKEAAAD